jgi:isochorismate pyruvate lyase
MPPHPTSCTHMAEVRAEIDRIDAALVDLIAERFGYVDRAWQLKHANGTEGAVVPWRIQQVIDTVRARAVARGLPPDMVDMVGAQWRNMIGWFIQYEEEKLRKVREEGAAAGIETGDAEGLEASPTPVKS